VSRGHCALPQRTPGIATAEPSYMNPLKVAPKTLTRRRPARRVTGPRQECYIAGADVGGPFVTLIGGGEVAVPFGQPP